MKKDKVKIYDIDYLMNSELSDEDMYNLCEKGMLVYSLIIGEFKAINSKLKDSEIINLCRQTNNWPYKYFWSDSQREQFTDKLVKVYKNIYQYDNSRCLSLAQWFIIKYGLNNIKLKNKKINTLES